MRRRRIPRTALLGLGISMLVVSGVASAQQPTDALQGRLLERSDGTTFVYRDGARYSVQPADLSDADIDALPISGAADRLDQFFAQSSSADATTAIPLATISPALPEAGTLLYQVDWSSGANGWALPGDWQVANGFLSNTGTLNNLSVIAAPYQPPSPDYAVEADVQPVKYVKFDCCSPHGFGLISRGDPAFEFHAGILDAGQTAGIALFGPPAPISLGHRAFNTGSGWHTYRLEAKDSNTRLLIDGVVWTQGSPNPPPGWPFPSGRMTGLWSQATQINIRSFRVFAL